MIKKILVANRAEIAIRVLKACKEMGISTVAIFAENDRDTLHIKHSQESYNLGVGTLKDTYLNIEKIINIAKESGADAIHPGYGFLSENENFAKACEENNIIFIGPTSEVMHKMGDKLRARAYMKEANVPITPGTSNGVKDPNEVIEFGKKYGYPIALKASAGGGGRGIKPIFEESQVKEALESAMREGLAYFGDDTVYIEKFLSQPRHIEVQILGDGQGNVVHLGERNCSVQRRNQKLIEEAPSPCLVDNVRKQILDSAVQGAKHLNYRGAGTFEFLEQDGQFYFMEVNTRLQVEHPVTEMIYGVDLVKEQINIASGNKLSYKQEDLIKRGHSIEFRITVEDVKSNFRPMAGFLEDYSQPSGFGVRVDSTGYKGWNIPSEYDSMISKLIVWDENRERAINKAKIALNDYIIKGVPTTIDFHKWSLDQKSFVEGNYSTKFIAENFDPSKIISNTTISNNEGITREKSTIEVEVNGKFFNVDIYTQQEKKSSRSKKVSSNNSVDNNNSNEINSPMAGTVVKLMVEKGQSITKGQTILILESMKMESDINSHKDGTVKNIQVKAGDAVTNAQLLVELE